MALRESSTLLKCRFPLGNLDLNPLLFVYIFDVTCIQAQSGFFVLECKLKIMCVIFYGKQDGHFMQVLQPLQDTLHGKYLLSTSKIVWIVMPSE